MDMKRRNTRTFKRSALHSPSRNNIKRSPTKLPKSDEFKEAKRKTIFLIENEDVNKSPNRVVSIYLEDN